MFSYDLLGCFYCFLSVFPSFPILDLVNTYFGYKETTVESAYSFSGLAEKPRTWKSFKWLSKKKKKICSSTIISGKDKANLLDISNATYLS